MNKEISQQQLDDLIDKAAKAQKENASEKEAKRDRIAKAAFACFDTEAGKIVLDYFRDNTILSPLPVCNPFLKDNAAEMGFFRSGQNAIIIEIEQLIKQGKESGNANS